MYRRRDSAARILEIIHSVYVVYCNNNSNNNKNNNNNCNNNDKKKIIIIIYIEFKRLSSNIKLINAPDALLILKASSSTLHVLFMLCCSPCLCNAILSQIDEVLKSNISHIANVVLSDAQWIQASLPVKAGVWVFVEPLLWLCQHIWHLLPVLLHYEILF